MLNNHCFPDVKCPLGCWQFMDCCRKIPFHHCLSMVCNEKFVNSNSKLFESARKDWPLTDAFMRWKISPTLVISKSEGLSVLVCEDHTNQDLQKKYFHLPTNPFYSPHNRPCQEVLATCSIEPNVMRAAVKSSYNTSAAKILVLGGYFGINSFHIAGRSSVEDFTFDENDKVGMSHAHALINREEIMEAFRKEHGDSHGRDMIKCYDKSKPAEVNESSGTQGATFMHINDNYVSYSLLRKEINTSNASITSNASRCSGLVTQ